MTPIERLAWLVVVCKIIACRGPCMAIAAIMADAARVDDSGTTCWPGVVGMMERTGLKRNAIVDAIKRLEAHGVVTIERRFGGSNVYHLIPIDRLPRTCEPVCGNRLPRTKPTGWRTRIKPVAAHQPEQGLNLEENLVVPVEPVERCAATGLPGTEKKGPVRFAQPSMEEIKSYCEERGNNVDAEKFLSYYESIGWMVGKKRMKDWRAAVRTWEKNDRNAKGSMVNPHAPESPAWYNWWAERSEKLS